MFAKEAAFGARAKVRLAGLTGASSLIGAQAATKINKQTTIQEGFA